MKKNEPKFIIIKMNKIISVKLIAIVTLLLLFILSCKKTENVDNLFDIDTIVCNENKIEIYTSKSGERNGVMTSFINNKKFEERLYINDKLIIEKDFNVDSMGFSRSYFYNIEDTLKPIGSLLYEKENQKKIQHYCSYFEVEAKDTIFEHENLKIKIIGNFGTFKDFSVQLVLGEIDENYNLTKKDTTFLSDSNMLEFEYFGLKEGINLLTGFLYFYDIDKDLSGEFMLYRLRDNQKEVPYVFYKQIYVLPASEKDE